MISIQRIQQRRRRSALTCVAALSACMGLGALGCGGNQSDAEYPEESYNEAPPPDPYSGMEGAPEEPGAPGDPNAVPGGEPETMPGEQPGTMPGDQPGAPGQPGQPAQPGAAPGEPGAPGPQGATPQETAPTAKVTTEEVDAFSTCLVKIMELQKTFEQRAEQGEPQQQLQTEFQQQAVAILNQEGLSPQRYDEIARLMSQDPQLQERVREAIEAEAQS